MDEGDVTVRSVVASFTAVGKIGIRGELVAEGDVRGGVRHVGAPTLEVFPILERAFRTFQPRVPAGCSPASLLGGRLVHGHADRRAADVPLSARDLPSVHWPKILQASCHALLGLQAVAAAPRSAHGPLPLAFLPMTRRVEPPLESSAWKTSECACSIAPRSVPRRCSGCFS